jgi:Bifunctional DNA primase/polymerase, N-terminal/Primase C terminal 1 (PriCT-1)
MATLSALHVAALELNRRYAIFPCQPGGKDPVTDNGFHGAVKNDPDRINSWWGQVPNLNIGIATGAPSNIWVLDIDGAEAEHELHKLEAEHGLLPATVEVITGRGRHIYFALNGHGPIKGSAGKIGPGLDVRADGNYVVCPPSLHESGRNYCWSVDSADTLAEAPAWLVTLAKNANPPEAAGKPLEHWDSVLTNPIPDGERNNTLASVCGKLLFCGLTDIVLLYDIMLCINIARCSPPLHDADIEKIVSSVVRGHLMRKLRR